MNRGSWWTLPLAALLFVSLGSSAAEPPTTPLLRVETGMHTTLIRRLVVDVPRNRIVTCSDDKTIRVWQMPEQRLVTTLRVPLGSGHEGQLFGLAVSPDGRTIAAGGWTGWDWEGKASVYLFDIDSGEMVGRIGGLTDAIHAIAWSPNGEHLAIGLQGRAGLRILSLREQRIIASDSAYNDKLTDLSYASDGRLVTTALDGMVRLYDNRYKLRGRRIIPGGKKPIAVKFSPDNKEIAVSYADVPGVSIASAKNLELLHHPDNRGMAQQLNLLTVTWSDDGEYLYAGGEYRGDGPTPLYRWSKRGRGERETIPVSRNRIPEIQQLPDGAIAFAAEDPGFGVVDRAGKVVAFRRPDILDFSRIQSNLLTSRDGLTIQYPTLQPGVDHTFSLLAGGEQSLDTPKGETLLPPRLKSDTFTLTDWKNGYSPLINGIKPQLDDYEMVRSYAIAPDGQKLLLGTEWAIRLLDNQAREQWSVKLAAVAWSVTITDNGRLAIAALSDGTLRWYRMEDGSELCAFFPHANGRDWIAWLPNGYYLSSLYGDNYVGWHLNRGKNLMPDFYRAVQFERLLYRPDVVREAIRPYAATRTRGLPARSKPTNADFTIDRLADIAPPRLRLEVGKLQLDPRRPHLPLTLRGEKSRLPMQDVTVYVNNIPVTPTTSRLLNDGERQHFTRNLAIPLHDHGNNIRVEVFNGVSMGVIERYIALPPGIKPATVRGDLYLLAVGVNKFPKLSPDVALAYATNDASAITEALKKNGRDYFRTIHTDLITDDTAAKPDRKTIRNALAFIQQAQPEDTVILFLASHGISDTAGNYYFVPRDAVEGDLDRLFDGGEITSLMPWQDFFDALRLTAGRRLLIVDTCQARNIEGRFEAHSLMKRSASSLFSLLLASKGNEESQEHASARHGLFTYSLLKAMQRESDSNGDGRVSLKELFQAATPILEKNRDKRIGPQTPQLIAPEAVGDFILIAPESG